MTSMTATRPWDGAKKEFAERRAHKKANVSTYAWLIEAVPVWPEEASCEEIAVRTGRKTAIVWNALCKCMNPQLAMSDDGKYCRVIW